MRASIADLRCCMALDADSPLSSVTSRGYLCRRDHGGYGSIGRDLEG
jgi:hypothetical protein